MTREIEIKFEPPLHIPPRARAEVNICEENGRARVTIRSIDSGVVLELRPDCQLIEADGSQVIVAAPGSIEHPKLNWKQRLFHWLAKG